MKRAFLALLNFIGVTFWIGGSVVEMGLWGYLISFIGGGLYGFTLVAIVLLSPSRREGKRE